MLRIKLTIFGLLVYTVADVSAGARIVSMQGDVKVRRGLEENWQLATSGMLLEDMDSILNGEASEALLEMENGRTFRLGGNAILDISDLRPITEQQLFLYLTAQKIRSLDPPENQKPIRIQNVSTVRADDRSEAGQDSPVADNPVWMPMTNAALAMIEQDFYPNAVMKIHKILDAHAKSADKARLHCYLGRSFEALEDQGRALEAYQASAGYCKPDQERIRTEALDAIRRIKNQ